MESGQKGVATNEPGNRVPRKRKRPSENQRFLINAQIDQKPLFQMYHII